MKKIWQCIGMAFLCFTLLMAEILTLGLAHHPATTLLKFGFAWFLIWILSCYHIIWGFPRAEAALTGLMIATAVWGIVLRNPGTAAAIARHQKVFDHDNAIGAIASTLREYRETSCSGLSFFGNDPLNPRTRIPLVGIVTSKDGRIHCYDLRGHLDDPGVNTDGIAIVRVERQEDIEKIRDQNEVDRQRALQEAAQRKALILEQQRTNAFVPVPIPLATSQPESTPPTPPIAQHCLEEIPVVLKKSVKLDKLRRVRAELNESIRDANGTTIASAGSPVKLTFSQPITERFGRPAIVAIEIEEVRGTDIRGKVSSITIEAQRYTRRERGIQYTPLVPAFDTISEEIEYRLETGVHLLVLQNPICTPAL